MHNLALRREKLFDLMQDNSVAIVFAGAAKICSQDEYYPFYSDNNFYYLTHIQQENSILLLVKCLGENKTFLFIEEKNELKEKWTGKRLNSDEASNISNINNIYFRNSFESTLSLILSGKQFGLINHVYIDLTPELKIDKAYSTKDFKKTLENDYSSLEIIDLFPYIRDLRMIKDDDEINDMLQAINMTNNGINYLLLNLKDGIKENALSDKFEFYGREYGLRKLAFSTITASGKNATCLHYPSQLDIVRNGDLVLFDLGYSYNGYSADISRTFPVNGVFSDIQKNIYEAVLNCNKAVIDYIKVGLTLKDLQDFAKKILKEECVKRKLLKPEEDITKVYYHSVSHHLGLDTHDVSNREKPLENGNVITVEPGLYFAELGIGVRIEDDILLKDDKALNLSKDIIKEVEDIEKLFKSRG